ncbi:uncharacterized protein BN613_00445 [Cryptobacterium sp. CAG:338]|nr:uncharacterized protein BN613_00445 [Cryptobacterium sp. CAG:338]
MNSDVIKRIKLPSIPSTCAQFVATMYQMHFFCDTRKIDRISTGSISSADDNGRFIFKEATIAGSAVRNSPTHKRFNTFNRQLSRFCSHGQDNRFRLIRSRICFQHKYRISLIIHRWLKIFNLFRANFCAKTFYLFAHSKRNFKPINPLGKTGIVFQMVDRGKLTAHHQSFKQRGRKACASCINSRRKTSRASTHNCNIDHTNTSFLNKRRLNN